MYTPRTWVGEAKAHIEAKTEVRATDRERVNETGESWLVALRSDAPRVAMRRALDRVRESSGPVMAGPVV